MNAYKAEAVLTEDGKLTLTGLPFQSGKTVEVIVVERSLVQSDPVAIDDDRAYFAGVSSLMNEWDSEEDELAYGNL
jgi:hypothetical protein